MQQQAAQNDATDPRVETRGFRTRNQVLERNMDECPTLGRIVALLEGATGRLSSIPGLSDLLDEFRESGEVSALLRQEFERTMFEMSPPPLGNSLTLYQGPRHTLSCDRYDRLTLGKFVTTIPCSAQMRLLRSTGEVSFSRYRLPPGLDMSVLDPRAKLELVHESSLSPTNARAFFDADDVITLEGRGSLVIISLREHSMSPFTWAFETSSLTPVFITVSDQSYNRWKMLIELIVKFHGTPYQSVYSSDLLTQLGDHELHYLRWSACQALAKTDLANARQLIAKLANDPHTHVRRAATAALQRLQALEVAA